MDKFEAERVRELFTLATPEERLFYGGAPSVSNIKKSIDALDYFRETGRVTGKRVGFGDVYFRGEDVLGYHAFTIMNNANPTKFERDNIGMGKGLNYVYLKKIFVHPDFRSEGIGTMFVENAVKISKELDKHCIAEVNRENYSIANILSQAGFGEDFEWTTPRGEEMIRFYRYRGSR